MNRTILIAALIAFAALTPTAKADPGSFDCQELPPEVQYQVLCDQMSDTHAWYHCALLVAPIAPGIVIGQVLFMVTNAGPMVRDVECQVAAGTNRNIHWWNDVWNHTGRQVFCFTWGPSPEACPNSPNGVRAEATEYFVCVSTPGGPILACQLPTLPPLPAPWIPGPPPYP